MAHDFIPTPGIDSGGLSGRVRFGVFEVELRAGELSNQWSVFEEILG